MVLTRVSRLSLTDKAAFFRGGRKVSSDLVRCELRMSKDGVEAAIE
jgi:hypothetical protein